MVLVTVALAAACGDQTGVFPTVASSEPNGEVTAADPPATSSADTGEWATTTTIVATTVGSTTTAITALPASTSTSTTAAAVFTTSTSPGTSVQVVPTSGPSGTKFQIEVSCPFGDGEGWVRIEWLDAPTPTPQSVEAHNTPILDGGFGVEWNSGQSPHWVEDPDGRIFYDGLGANPGVYRFSGSCGREADSPGVEALFTITAADPVYLVDAWRLLPDVLPAPGDTTLTGDPRLSPRGSGCVVDGTTLPNGVWFGFVRSLAAGQMTFDLGCFFASNGAFDAAAADGGSIVHTLEITGTDNDGRLVASQEPVYVRNRNPLLFSVPIDPGAQMWNAIVSTGIDSLPTPFPVTAWPSAESPLQCPGPECGVWLYVNGGRVTAIVEQYLF